ncbi:MAG: PKD domain-containing protein [Candidatus Hydrogenedentes bacterium]|nr:PKD domain-containing protein [Candidatus Hydrogenedentota bacterium]
MSSRGKKCILFVFIFFIVISIYGYTDQTEYHSADKDRDGKINLSELLRVIQFYNVKSYHCDPNGEDGYNPGPGDQSCEPHDSDFEENNKWRITLNEILRLIQFYNSCGYEPYSGTEDGFRPILCPPNNEEGELEGSPEGEGEVYQYARVVIDRKDAVPNSDVSVPFTLDTKDVFLDSIQFDLLYNHRKLNYVESIPGLVIFNTGRSLTVSQIVPGRLRVVISGTSTTGMSSGLLMAIRFHISEEVDFGDIYSLYSENILSTTYPQGILYPLSILAGWIRIYSALPYPPKANFSASPTRTLVGTEVEFTDESRLGNGTDPQWLWNFGDGSFSVQRDPVHIYTQPGVYTVRLSVTTTAGTDTIVRENYIEIHEGVRIHVKKSNVNKEVEPDGLTWDSAYTTIQEGINKAYELGGGEVWVAGGIYDEVRNNPYGALVLRELVKLYGGFSGNEISLSQRNFNTNVTVIDGSKSRAGEPAWHVLLGDNYCEIDGFVIKGGIARFNGIYLDASDGGGLYIPGKRMTVRNCKFFQNKAEGAGGAIAILSGKLSAYDCHFIENRVELNGTASVYNYGGAVYVSDSVANFVRCRFERNVANARCEWKNSIGNVYATAGGGAIYSYNSSLSLENSYFYLNSCSAEGIGDGRINGNYYGAVARALGGAIYLWYSSFRIESSEFRNNSVSTNDHPGYSRASGGMGFLTRSSGKLINSVVFRNQSYDFSYSTERTGGLHLDFCENIIVTNCTFYGNMTDLLSNIQGGAVFNYYGGLRFGNTIIWENSGAGVYSLGGEPEFYYCNLQVEKQGVGNISVDPLFVFPQGGNLRLSSSSPCVDAGFDTSSEEWGSVIFDIENNMRGRDGISAPRGDGSDYDIGAYEY